MPRDWEKTNGGFHTTRWTLIDAARGAEGEARERALRTLIETYWPAIYGWARRSGMPREEAAEFTQAFFADKVLPGDLFQRADPERGRLRTLLLTAAKNFRIDQHRKDAKHNHQRLIPEEAFDHEERLLSAHTSESAESFFDRRWALAVLDEALDRARAHYLGIGKEAHWHAFEARILRPSASGVEPVTGADLAPRLGFRTQADVASAVHVVKKRVRLLVREVVAESSSQLVEAEEELALVARLLNR